MIQNKRGCSSSSVGALVATGAGGREESLFDDPSSDWVCGVSCAQETLTGSHKRTITGKSLNRIVLALPALQPVPAVGSAFQSLSDRTPLRPAQACQAALSAGA